LPAGDGAAVEQVTVMSDHTVASTSAPSRLRVEAVNRTLECERWWLATV